MAKRVRSKAPKIEGAQVRAAEAPATATTTSSAVTAVFRERRVLILTELEAAAISPAAEYAERSAEQAMALAKQIAEAEKNRKAIVEDGQRVIRGALDVLGRSRSLVEAIPSAVSVHRDEAGKTWIEWSAPEPAAKG